MVKVLSFDPAIKNLAACKMDIDNNKISNLECNIFDLADGKKAKSVKFEKMINNLLDKLGTIDCSDVKLVLIENIPSMRNPTVKSISIAIFTYFAMKNFDVHFVSPSRKLSKEENKLSYRERKKASINKAFALLNEDDKIKLNDFKKIDDIADCINQAINYLRNKND